MLRLLHLADLHLGWLPRDLPPEVAETRRVARDARLGEAVELALSERVHAVLVVGDLFDDFAPPADLVRYAREALGRLVAAGISVVTVPGNHDELTYATSVYRREAERWPGLLVRAPMPAALGRIEAAGTTLHVHGVAYVGGVTDVANVLRALPPRESEGRQLFLAHGTLRHGGGDASAGGASARRANGAAGSNDVMSNDRSLPLPRAALAVAGYDYLALGHLHRPSEERLGGGLAVYPGCVGGKGFDDPGARHWTLVTFTPGGPRVEQRPLRGQQLVDEHLDVSDCDHEGAVLEALAAVAGRHAGDLLRVRLTGALPAVLDPEDLATQCGGDTLYLRVEDHTTAVSPALLDAWGASPTVRGAFVRRLQARLDAAQDEDERALVVRALRQGLAALEGER